MYELELSVGYLESSIDMELFMDPSPYCATWTMSVDQAFTILRGIGLRHLPVTTQDGQLVGVITRHDLTQHAIDSFLDRSRVWYNRTLIRILDMWRYEAASWSGD